MKPTPTVVYQVLAALVALAWRGLSQPVEHLWRDWVVLLSLYWIYTVFCEKKPHWPKVTAAVMAFMLGIYVQGQWIHVLSVLVLAP